MELNGKKASTEDIAPLALYNYGNYTTMLVADSKVRGLKLHLDRLDRGAQLLFGKAVDKELVQHWVRQAVESTQPLIVRVTIFSRDFNLVHPAQPSKLDILVTTRPAPTGLQPMSLKPVVYQRDLADHKTASIGGALYRRRTAQLDGFDDALFMNSEEEISEGPTWNIGFTQNGTVILPTAPSLPGISIALLRQSLIEQGTTVRFQTVRLQDIPSMDSCFIISAGSGIRGVETIGKQSFKPDDTLNMLRNAYEKIPYDSL